MSPRYPRIRLPFLVETENEEIIILRDSVCIAFYVDRNHGEIAQVVAKSLSRYEAAVGPASLALYVDNEGDWQELDAKGRAFVQEEFEMPLSARIELSDSPESLSHSFKYRGESPIESWGESEQHRPISSVEFYLPTEYLLEHGAGRVRDLSMELGAELPFVSGHAGLSFHMAAWMRDNTPVVRELSQRHPGFDLPGMDELRRVMGSRTRGASWLTFLGQPILGGLGGVAGLRAQLKSPGTTVQEMSGDRAVVSLGEWPEAGDLETGDTLPHYRELARVLEPWMYTHGDAYWGNLTPEEIRRWERRFLD